MYRDQDLTKEQLIAFSRRWGPLGEHIMPGAASDDYEELNVMSNKGKDGKPTGKHPDPTAKRWHTDRSYMPRPAMTTILYGVEVPKVGGDTLFANGTMAYDALPDDVRNADRQAQRHPLGRALAARRRRGAGDGVRAQEGAAGAPSARASASCDRQEGDLLRLPRLEGRGSSPMTRAASSWTT